MRPARPRCLACTPWRLSDIFAVMCVQQCAPGARVCCRAMRATVPSIFRGPLRRAENRRCRRYAETGASSFLLRQRTAGCCVPVAVPQVDAPRRRAAAPTGLLISGGARAPATRGSAARTGAGHSRVLAAAHGMRVEMSGRRHAGHAGRVGWREVCIAWSRASGDSRIAFAVLHVVRRSRCARESGQAWELPG